MSLHACPGCQRHVRASSTTCPFCGAPVQFEERPVSEGGEHPGRARLMLGLGVGAIAVSSALVGSGCAIYGAPVDYDASVDDAPSGQDSGNGSP